MWIQNRTCFLDFTVHVTHKNIFVHCGNQAFNLVLHEVGKEMSLISDIFSFIQGESYEWERRSCAMNYATPHRDYAWLKGPCAYVTKATPLHRAWRCPTVNTWACTSPMTSHGPSTHPVSYGRPTNACVYWVSWSRPQPCCPDLFLPVCEEEQVTVFRGNYFILIFSFCFGQPGLSLTI